MAFVSCEKQISSFASAIGSASVADKQAIVAALSVNKDVAYVESRNYKEFTPELRPNPSILPRGNLVKFNASGDTSANASFGTWNPAKDTFSFSKSGNYYINFEASIQAMVQTRGADYQMSAGSFFRIGGKDWHASGYNVDCTPGSVTFQGESAHGSITVSANAGQTLQLYGFLVSRNTSEPNTVGIGAPAGWTWGIQITQV